ncbi:MAG: pstP, partial [Modestobacter sp.]|nr:pstP [Modestobacter sp.]
APVRRRPLRTVIIALATVLVLGVVAVGGYLFVMRHWFVGVHDTADGQQVAVFQGLDASIVGMELYRLESATGLASTDLTQAARSRVRAGITAGDREDAERILSNLRGQQLPLCRTASAGRTTAGSTSTGEDTTSPAASTTESATPSENATPSQSATATDDSASATASSTPSPTGSASRTGEPGVDCREDD